MNIAAADEGGNIVAHVGMDNAWVGSIDISVNDACLASIVRPATQERIKKLIGRGFSKPGDAENRLGEFMGQIGR